MSILETRPAAVVTAPPAARPRRAEPAPPLARAARAGWLAGLAGAAGMVFVGGSVAVSGTLAGAPLFTAQAVRYGIACLLLLGFCRLTGRSVRRPRGTEWLWLIGVAGTGLLLFNVALVRGARHAEPAVLGVAVACVPVVLAALGPLLEGTRPRRRVLLAAAVVTAGAVLVEGTGRTDALGLAWALVVFACEAGFTLLAVPLLRTHGPEGVSVHTTWIAALAFAGVGVGTEGPGAVLRLGGADWAAIAYLAVAVTAVAFVLWYSCVRRLGASRAGLITGVAPVAAAAVGIPVSGALPALPVWGGIVLIAVGLTAGLG